MNRLTPICVSHYDKKHNKYILYQCECGNQIVARETNVKNGRTKSCGCLRKESPTLSSRKRTTSLRQGHSLGKKNKNNTSGVTGVSYHKRIKRWEASLDYNGVRHRVYCMSKEEAIEARKQMEKELSIYERVFIEKGEKDE